MQSPARVLERLNRVLERGAWERIERRRAHLIAAHPIDPELGWLHYEDLQEAVLPETNDLARKAMLLHRPADAHLVASTLVLCQWRLTRGLYEFDETLREQLDETSVDRIPVDVLRRLPEYAPYLTLGGVRLFGRRMLGAWVMFGHARTRHPQVNAVAHFDDDSVVSLILDLPSADFEECLASTVANARRGLEKAKAMGVEADLDLVSSNATEEERFWRMLLPLALYLCSEEPDITGAVKAPQASHKRRYAHMFIPPQADNMLAVGFRHGGVVRMWRQQLNARAPESSGLGMPKAPHIRKAHFHLYWTGAGRTVPRVKWVAATPVNVKDVENMPVHVRPVQGDPADAR